MIISHKESKQASIMAVDCLAKDIQNLLQTKNQVIIGTVGGRSIQNIYNILKTKTLDWNKIHFFLVDDRLVDIKSEESNSKLMLDNLSSICPKENLHPFIYDDQAQDFGTKAYEQELSKYGGKFDIILLGTGEDGHIGALYPNHHSIQNDNDYFITMHDSPKPPKDRMTAAKNLLLKTKIAYVLFFSRAKQQALRNFQDESKSIQDCPAKLVQKLPKYYVITDIQGDDEIT